MKHYWLCTSNGIPLYFIVYHGNITQQHIEVEEVILITERIPATHMERYFGRGHILYIDNFYTSLTDWQITSLRLAKCHRNYQGKQKQLQLELKNTFLQKGEAAFYQHDSIVTVKSRARRDSARGQPKVVYVLSTSHRVTMKNTNRVDTNGNAIKKPTILLITIKTQVV